MATAVLWIRNYDAMVFITVIDNIMKMKRNGVILLSVDNSDWSIKIRCSELY